jgi:formylglycine-generating enzyme required for sulfatase activity
MKTVLRIVCIVGVPLCLVTAAAGWLRAAEQAKPAVNNAAAPDTLTNSIGMKFILIKPGSFKMGNTRGDDWEAPVHKVTLTKSYYLQTTEVTQAQWAAVMADTPSHFKGGDLPVETVSWHDCQKFVEQLNAKEGVTAYRLPTEAEWEYACRAGTTTYYYWGDSFDPVGEYAWHGGNSNGKTHPAGLKKPNAWGLYDMNGNVVEWCQDWFDTGYYSKSPVVDPPGPEESGYKVMRGGGWYFDTLVDFTSTFRYFQPPAFAYFTAGFRVVRSL